MSQPGTASTGKAITLREPLRGLATRLALALAASTAGAMLTYLLLGSLIPNLALRAVVATLVAVGAVGVLLQSMIVSPLVATSEALEDRYQAALADSLTDPLTALGNHRAFQEELDRQVEHAQRYGVPLALVLIDIDEFKAINDDAGHAQGDQALADFGRLVMAGLRRVDRPFRVGGDEFALLLPHTDAEAAKIVARRLLASALQPPRVELGRRAISFSAGISTLPDLADTRAQLYSQADAALYAAKRAGRTEVALFDPASATVELTTGSGTAIAEVIARKQLRPVYQPIVALDGLMVLGYEGLIRPVAPAPFADPTALFAAATASGHLVALDMTCIDTIVAGARELAADQFLSVNITQHTIEAAEFTPVGLLSILARHHFPPNRLVLELTEREPLNEPDKVRAKLDECRVAGIRLAADDVGAGNAGLRLLSELQFDILKIDLSLVQRSTAGTPSSAVIGSVVSYAGRSGALVVGEGVERMEEVAQLAVLGVSAGQGFFFGRPGSIGVSPANEVRRELAADVETVSEDSSTAMSAWRRSIGLPTPVTN